MGGKRERKARNPAEQQRRLEKRREKAKIKKNRLSALEGWVMKNSPSQVEDSIKSLQNMLKRARKEGRPDFEISHKLSQLESAYERLKPKMVAMDKKRQEIEAAKAARQINADWADPASKARRKAKKEAEYSVYYDERFNPFGIPPPGKQTLFRHKDGTLHNYPPPDISDDEDDSSDDDDDSEVDRVMRQRAAALQRKRAGSSSSSSDDDDDSSSSSSSSSSSDEDDDDKHASGEVDDVRKKQRREGEEDQAPTKEVKITSSHVPPTVGDPPLPPPPPPVVPPVPLPPAMLPPHGVPPPFMIPPPGGPPAAASGGSLPFIPPPPPPLPPFPAAAAAGLPLLNIPPPPPTLFAPPGSIRQFPPQGGIMPPPPPPGSLPIPPAPPLEQPHKPMPPGKGLNSSDPYERARQAAAAAAAKAAQERARKDEAAKKSAILERFAVEGGDSSKAGVVAEAKAVKPQLKLFVPSQVRSSTSKTAAAAPPELITLDSDKVHIKKKPKQEVPPVGQQHPQGGGMKRSAAPPTGSLEDDFDRFMGEVNEMGVED